MIEINRWAVGFNRSTGNTIIRLEFSDRPAVEFSMPQQQALEAAHAIIEQYRVPPPTQN